MGRVAIDTSILIRALVTGPIETGTPLYAQIAAAKRVLDEQDEVVVPAPAWFEMMRKATPQEAAALRGFANKLSVASMDGPAAERASELVRAIMGMDVCDACLNELPPATCGTCGAARGKPGRILDAIVVAVAEQENCECLYMDDDRARRFAGAARIPLKVPEVPPQLPLLMDLKKKPAAEVS